MYGWTGNLLRVDLTKKEARKEPIPQDLLINYIGGEGLGVRLLYDETPAGIHPYDPRMAFIVSAGPLNGTLAPCSGRLEIVTKSPSSGLLGDANTGGEFAPELRWAGYDAIVIKGKAEEPVYLWIDDDEVEIRDARHIWGKPVREAIDIVQAELKDHQVKTLSIGPAAENKVVMAVTYSGYTGVAAWGGGAAVMGSKNLKLIAVRGTKGINIAVPREFEKVCKEILAKNKTSRVFNKMAEEGVLGTAAGQRHQIAHELVRNLQETRLSDEQYQKLSYESFSKYKVKNLACFGCPLHCGHFVRIPGGPYGGLKMKGVEYWAMTAFGSMIDVYDSAFYIKATWDCDTYGMDMGIGYYLAFLSELYQRGIITKEDTDGLDFSWGNKEAYLEMLRKMAYREGFGAIFADGIDKAAERIGKDAWRYNMAPNNAPLDSDLRRYVGIALSTLTATRVGDTMKSIMYIEMAEGSVPKLAEKYAQQYLGIPSLAPEAVEGKDKVNIYFENYTAIINSLVLCTFTGKWMLGLKSGTHEDDYARLLTTGTGVEYDGKKLIEIGERLYRLQMAYNVREGDSREHSHYRLPPKFTEEPIKTGEHKGKVANAEAIYKLLDGYLEKRGFDPATGLPTKVGLEEVGLKDVADDLEALRLLAAR